MFDVRLLNIVQPASVPPAGAPTTVTPTVGAQPTTTQGTSILAQLPPGSLLSGFIINRDAQGNPVLRTDKGDVLFSSNFFLKIGSEVVIRVQNNAGHQNAHIVTVNGVPPEVAETQSGFADDGEIIVNRQPQQPPTPLTGNQTAGRTAAPGAAPPIQQGQTISAIVVIPAPPSEGTPSLPPGTSLLLNVLGVNQPIKPTTNSPLAQLTPNNPAQPQAAQSNTVLSSLLPTSPAPTATTSPTIQTTTQPLTTTAPAAPNTPQAATESSVIGQSAPYTVSNQQAAQAKLPNPLGQTVSAIPIAQSEDGTLLLNSPIGTLRVGGNVSIPIGQPITLRVSSVATPNNYTIAVANQAPLEPATPITQLSRAWTSLAQIVDVIGEEKAAQIIPTFSTTIPLAEGAPRIPQASSQVLFFLAALGGGNLRSWLGHQNIRTLEDKGYGSLIRKAEGEFMLLARQFAEPQPGNWQSAYFPVMASGELQQVRAYFKREKKKNEHGQLTGNEDTRFVVEMDLSQLGEMQMDGLVKRRDNNLQFDLVIRSLKPLPRHMEQDIQAIYANTAELTGYKGQIAFQSVTAFPVHPLEDTTPHVFDDIVI